MGTQINASRNLRDLATDDYVFITIQPRGYACVHAHNDGEQNHIAHPDWDATDWTWMPIQGDVHAHVTQKNFPLRVD